MSRGHLRRHEPFLAVVAAYLVLGLAYNAALPVGEAPDEPTHAEYVRYLLKNRSLPTLDSGQADERAASAIAQGGHPPLFYLVAASLASPLDWERPMTIANPHFSFNREGAAVPNAFVHFPTDTDFPYEEPGITAVHAMRLASLAGGLLVVVAAYALGRLAWPADPPLAWAAAAVVGFLPGLLFMSAAVNNDALAAGLCGLAVVGAVRAAQGAASRGELAAWGGVLGLALLAKMSALFLVPLVLVSVLRGVWRRQEPAAARLDMTTRRLLGDLVALGAGTMLVAGWWLARGVALYGSRDPLGWRAFQEAGVAFVRRVPLSSELDAYLRIQLETFVGRFGWSTAALPSWLYAGFAVLLVLALAGLCVTIVRRPRPDVRTREAIATLALAVVLAYLAVLRLGQAMDLSVAHGRYLYVAVAPLGVLVVSGLAGPWQSGARIRICAALAVGSFLTAASALVFVLRPAFVVRAPAGVSEVASVDAEFGGRVGLRSYAFPWGPPTPGRPLAVQLQWVALPGNRRLELQPDSGRLWQVPVTAEPEVVFVHLVDASGQVVGRIDQAPFDGRLPVLAWPPGESVRQRLTLDVSPTALPGEGALRVGIYPEGRPDDALRVTRAGEAPAGSYWIRPVRIAEQPP